MRLPEFIVANIEPILAEWEAFARSLLPGAKMTILALRDDAESILRATVRDMQNAQSLQQQGSKSKGHGGAGGEESDRLDNASELHGVGRVGSGFRITELVAEYRALRASVLRLWRESLSQPDVNDINDITRFGESMDQLTQEYWKNNDQSDVGPPASPAEAPATMDLQSLLPDRKLAWCDWKRGATPSSAAEETAQVAAAIPAGYCMSAPADVVGPVAWRQH